jgi:hypothetical protein
MNTPNQPQTMNTQTTEPQTMNTQPEIDAYLAATRPKPKPKKFTYLYVLQGQYAHSWADLAAEDKAEAGAWSRIKQTRKEYRENEGGSYRIISRREAATA